MRIKYELFSHSISSPSDFHGSFCEYLGVIYLLKIINKNDTRSHLSQLKYHISVQYDSMVFRILYFTIENILFGKQ